MTTSEFFAYYAAIVATIALLLTFIKDIVRPAKLKFKSVVEWGPSSGWSTPNQVLIFLTITNCGYRTITITDIVPISYEMKEGTLYKPDGLPKTLSHGEATTVVADIALGGEGWKYLDAEDSTGKRFRIPQEEHSKLKASATPFINHMESINRQH